MSNTQCVWIPDAPNGKPSKLYQDLAKELKSRPLTNWFYAAYIAGNLGDALDNAGISRNVQGEHNATDVLNLLDWKTIASDIADLSLREIQIGAKDTNGQRIDYTDAKVALQKADAFNDTSKGLVASVVQHGNLYHIIVSEKNSRTHLQPESVKKALKTWEIYEQVFNGIGIDINNMPPETREVFNAFNTNLVNYLINLQRTDLDYINKREAMVILSLNPNSPHTQRAVNAMGSIENVAQAMDDINHGSTAYSNSQKTLIARAIHYGQQMQGLDLNALKAQVRQTNQQLINSNPEEAIKQTLETLNKKYKIGFNEIHRVSSEIRTLSDAVADAAVTLERQIRELEKIKGNNAEGRRLTALLNTLLKELNNKRYCSGAINFLNEASTHIAAIDTMLQSIPQTGTELEKAFETAKILQDIKEIENQYYPLIDALSNSSLIFDETISQADIDNIQQTASDLKDFFDKKRSVIKELTERNMVHLLTEIIGDKAPNGQSIINLVRMAAADSSIFDYLYSVGRASNPIIAAMGSIIRNAQNSRDEIMNAFALRIRKATDKLYKSGSNSEFMYEDDGHIISDIDWNAYKLARKAAIKAMYANGLRDFDLKEAIENWEDLNTEDRVVDAVSGRTEKVPNSNYRKAFPTLTQAQQEYYNTMMQIKGEIGTFLPSYAQHQYLPPQLRRDMLDALGKAKNLSDVYTAIKNKVENLWTVREDDTNYNTNGIIDGDEYNMTNGAFDNTPLRQIPIFFINKVEQAELLKDFSAGIQALAGTAINYDAMSNVLQVVEFIGDFAKNQQAREDPAKADYVGNKFIRVVKDLRKFGTNTNTVGLIDGFIDQHFYGVNQKEKGKWAKLWGNLIAYTSFKGLATNIKGAFSNYVVGEFQMLIEAGAGEFYGFKDYLWAHTKLFGGAGVGGELAELLTNNVNHKGVLFREMFDPINENFGDKSRQRYYTSAFRQLVSHDCSFIGYASGEYLIHYVNMYSILHNQKVLLNGRKISLYDAFEVGNKADGNSELLLKQGVTKLNGEAITSEWLDSIRKKIRYANQTTHGSMNKEDKGLIHQHWWGRGVMNFRQWMVEHYSRRFRKRHFDDSLGMDREGYWVSLYHHLWNEGTKDAWREGNKMDALGMFMRDFMTFTLRAQSQWSNLDEMQKYNVKRVHTEMCMYIALLGLSFALGEPDEHKKEFWRRWWIYQTKRLMLDTEASMPMPTAISSGLTMLQSPMAGVNTLNGLLYTFYGLTNGDLVTEIKSGPHKGENKYWRNIKKYVFPFFKDWEQMKRMSEDEAIFQVFEKTPSNY